MILLAIDPGTLTGWCYGFADATRLLERSGAHAPDLARGLKHGVEPFSLDRESSPGMRWIRFGAWLDGLPWGQSRGLVVYEAAHYAARFSSTAAAKLAAGFITRLEEKAARHGWELQPVPIMTLKKWATGSGKADKDGIRRMLRERFRLVIIDDNQADAIALWWYGYREVLGRPPEVPRLSQEVGV